MHLIFWKASDSPNGIQKHDLHIRNRRFNLLHPNPNLERKNIKNEFGFYCLFLYNLKYFFSSLCSQHSIYIRPDMTEYKYYITKIN